MRQTLGKEHHADTSLPVVDSLGVSVLFADPPRNAVSLVDRRPPGQRSIKRESPAAHSYHGPDAGSVFEFRLDLVGKRRDGVPEEVRSNFLGLVRLSHGRHRIDY